jgi:hypothetical protein
MTRSERIALIYVHGIGDQWRMEDPADLISKLDASMPPVSGGRAQDHLQNQPSRLSLPSGEEYLGLSTPLPNGSTLDLHEVYWAPLTGSGVSAQDVLRWLRRQLQVPFLRLNADWRRLARLRRGVLGQAIATGRITLTGNDQSRLLGHYESFQGDAACRAHARGTFDDFCLWLGTEDAPNSNLIPVAHDWHAQSRENDKVALGVVLSMVLMTFVFALLTVEAATGLLNYFRAASLNDWMSRYALSMTSVVDIFFIMPVVLLTVVISAAWLFGVRPFFQTYLGDAVQWATYHETNANFAIREAILKKSTEIFKAVLESALPYDRVIVMAHSLGSVIAHDTLLRLGERGQPGLDKVTHFLTYGSPIDKFAYFFEAQQGRTSRYETIINKLRGTVFSPPFRADLIWQNFYEEGDPIGGNIHTAGTADKLAQVENIYTANALVALVSPNHMGYTSNHMMLSRLWKALMPSAPAPQDTLVDVVTHTRWMRLRYAFILAVPWTLLGAYTMHGLYVLRIKSLLFPLEPYVIALLILAAGLLGLSGWLKVKFLGTVAAVLLGVAAFAIVALQGSTDLPDGPLIDYLLWLSAGIGTAAPVLLAIRLMNLTTKGGQQVAGAALRQQQLSKRPKAFVFPVMGVVFGLFMISVLMPLVDYPLLPFWWWRNMFVYATLSLMALGVAQFVYQMKKVPAHMLKK